MFLFLCVIILLSKAGMAKWLRQWVVVPLFAGSIPVTRPCWTNVYSSLILLYLIHEFYEVTLLYNFLHYEY